MEANEDLRQEIIGLYQINREQSAQSLLSTLNTPGRVQQRGFFVSAPQLLALIVASWRVDEKTRFVLYDIDAEELADSRCFRDRMDAAEEVERLPGDHCVIRLQVP